MQRGQLRDIPSWMVRLLPEPFEGFNKTDAFKMFSSKSTPTSTFYTDLETTSDSEDRSAEDPKKNGNSRDFQSPERRSATSEDGNSQDSDSVVGSEEQQQFSSHSFHRIASFGGFPRFQAFVMSASSPGQCPDSTYQETTTSIVQMSHSVLEYRSSRCV